LERAISTAAVPYLKRLINESLMVELQSVDRIVPPVVWSTIATGVSPAEHGILMPEVRRWRGVGAWMQVTPLELATRSILVHSAFSQRQPVSGYLRKSKAFWEILSDYGLRAGVVNWWGSWPAMPLRGWNVSERYYYKLMTKEKFQEETFPVSLFQKYSTATPRNVSGPEMDRFYANVFIRQLTNDPVRVASVYLPGFDILNYEFFESKKIDPFTYTGKYQQHLEWLDQTLRDIVAASRGHHLMILFHQGRSLSQQHSSLLIHWNNTAAYRKSSGTVSERSIVPLILYTCGLPVTHAMDTGLVSIVVPPAQLTQSPLRFIPGYSKKASAPDVLRVDQFNDLLIEQMKSLGYLQ
ncbi:MAG TPA: alkaline phosphatase family protein, partial [Acidobacteriota bacterium]|nr:alkaline phosphatase family protein [Acidobacteriota bacterium]